MATYICLLSWTQKGIDDIKSSPSRLDAARKQFRDLGSELKDFYLTTGRFDMVCVVEAKDDATFAKTVLALGSRGSVRTESLRAFTETEYRQIVGSLP